MYSSRGTSRNAVSYTHLDNDETGIAGLAGQVLGEFVRTRVVPEVDAYNLSKLGQFAVDQSQTVRCV